MIKTKTNSQVELDQCLETIQKWLQISIKNKEERLNFLSFVVCLEEMLEVVNQEAKQQVKEILLSDDYKKFCDDKLKNIDCHEA